VVAAATTVNPARVDWAFPPLVRRLHRPLRDYSRTGPSRGHILLLRS